MTMMAVMMVSATAYASGLFKFNNSLHIQIFNFHSRHDFALFRV